MTNLMTPACPLRPPPSGGCDNLIEKHSQTKIVAMASDDDKPRDPNRGDKDRPSGKASGRSGLANRSEPFDEATSVESKRKGGDPGHRQSKRPTRDPDRDKDRDKDRDRARDEDRVKDRDRERNADPSRRRRGSASAGARRSRPNLSEGEAEPLDVDPADPVKVPRRSRFGFRRRRAEAEDDPGRRPRRAAEDLADEELSEDDLADLPEPPRFRRPPWWVLLGGLILVLIVSSALYGEFNTERYFLVCSGSRAEAHRGRGFPWPFGHQAMVGAQYRAVPLGGDAQCQTQELDSEAELRHGLLKLVLVEAERLSHRTRSADLARARRMINQGALLAKNYKKERARLAALRATLDFQQARVVMRELETTLDEARRLFTKAKGQSKQHATEAAAWIRLLDRMLDQLRRRIAGDPVPPRRVGEAPTPTPARPAGMTPSGPRPTVSGAPTPDPMKSDPTAPPRRATPQPPPDAGVPGGGILL